MNSIRTVPPIKNCVNAKILLKAIDPVVKHDVTLIHNNFQMPASLFSIHPEKIKQLIKEKDAQNLCRIFCSEEYQAKLAETVYRQSKHVTEKEPPGVEYKYQHVINCAQPVPKRKPEVEKQPEQQPLPVPKKIMKKPQKLNIVSAMFKKKEKEMEREEEEDKEEQAEHAKNFVYNIVQPQTYHPSSNNFKPLSLKSKKKIKKRTTILPIFLKKLKEEATQKEVSKKNVEEQSDAVKFTDENEARDENVDEIDDMEMEERRSLKNESISYTRNYATSSKNSNRAESAPKVRHTLKKPTTPLARKLRQNQKSLSRKQEKMPKSCEQNLPARELCEIDRGLEDILDTSNLRKAKLSTCNFYKNGIVDDSLTLFYRVKQGIKDKSQQSEEVKQVAKVKHVMKIKKYVTKPSSKMLEQAKNRTSLTYITVDSLNKKRKEEIENKYGIFNI